MTELKPTQAYDLLEPAEKEAVDEYITYIVQEQFYKRQRIIEALNIPIPTEFVARSRGLLHRPLLRAAICERIKEEADAQDISPDRVIEEHASIAFANMNDFLVPTGLGDYNLRDIRDIPPEKMAAVKSIETKAGMYGMNTKIVLHDKAQSLKLVGELMGLQAPDKPPLLKNYVKPIDRRTEEQKQIGDSAEEYTLFLQKLEEEG